MSSMDCYTFPLADTTPRSVTILLVICKYGISGGWSRRITDEHRLVYQVLDDDLVVLQARYHYGR